MQMDQHFAVGALLTKTYIDETKPELAEGWAKPDFDKLSPRFAKYKNKLNKTLAMPSPTFGIHL